MVRAIGDRDDEFRILIDISRLEKQSANPEAALLAASDALRIARELGNSEGVREAALEVAGSLYRLEPES